MAAGSGLCYTAPGLSERNQLSMTEDDSRRRGGAERPDRRDFLRAFALGGSAALFARAGFAWPGAGELPPAPARVDEDYWQAVRREFVMPAELGVLNAANLCPSPAAVLEAMVGSTRDMDRDP